jgi:hypothetical protein
MVESPINIGGRLSMAQTVGIPPSIKTSKDYKQQQRQDLLAMARRFGTPEIFGTWTVDLSGPGFTGTLGARQHHAIEDVPLFCLAYRREWKRMWRFISGKWATRILGGLRASAYVTEYQDRGAPHIHYVLWTKRPIEELVQQNNSPDPQVRIVMCELNPADLGLAGLVRRYQVHKHIQQYCGGTEDGGCRFNFPKEVSAHTKIDTEHENIVYQRGPMDCWVNPYNMHLLKMSRSTMDMQLNVGRKTLSYICKYISKSEDLLKAMVAARDGGADKAGKEQRCRTM